MNPRISALLDRIRETTQKEIGKLIATTSVHEFTGPRALRLLGETEPLGENGNRYELRIYPAIAQVEVAPDSMVQFAFVVFSPTGALARRRDELARTRTTPNAAFLEMCTDLAPFTPEVLAIIDMLQADLAGLWTERTLAFSLMATSAELDLVAAFVDAGTFKQAALELGRRTPGSVTSD